MVKLLCITPNPAIDRTFVVPNLNLGEVHRSTYSLHAAGGKGVNVARAARVLGGDTTCAGFIGGEDGRRLASLTHSEGIASQWTLIDGETRTCVILVDADLGQGTVINEPGPTVTAEDWVRLQADVLLAAEMVDCICISGSAPPGSPLDAYVTLLNALRALDKPVWVDTSNVTLQASLGVKGIRVKVNHEEAGAIFGERIADIPSALAAAQALQKMGLESVVLTLGAFGAVLADNSGAWWSTPPPVKAVNAVGSGDSFLAGLAVAVTDKHPPPESLAWGVAAGTANAMASGGGHFTLDAFQSVLQNTSVHPA